MENTFDAICSALQEPENKDLFNESEGVDLMLIMMKYVLTLTCNSILIISAEKS